MPTFSVVIPAYRSAGTLARAVASALGQTEPPVEVVVVDDASPDDQLRVIARFGDRVRCVRRETNGGEAAAKNTGARHAVGDAVVTLDADDAWEPNRLAAIRARFDAQPELDIVTTDAYVVLDGRVLRRYYGGPTGATWAVGDQRMEILDRCFIFSHAAVRRELWVGSGGMDESDRECAADWPFWVRLVLGGAVAGLVDEPLVRYQLTSGSLSDSATTGLLTWRAAMAAALASPDARGHEQELAARRLAEADRQLHRMRVLREVWRGGAPRRGLASVAADRHVRRRHRAEAALGAVSPGLLRRLLGGDPDRLARG